MQGKKEALISRKSFLSEIKIKAFESVRRETECLREREHQDEQQCITWIMDENNWDYDICTGEYQMAECYSFAMPDNQKIQVLVERHTGEKITVFRSVCADPCHRWKTTKNCMCDQERFFKFKD